MEKSNYNSKSMISFYVMYKDFNTGEIKQHDVLYGLRKTIFSDKKLSKDFILYDKDYHEIPITTIERFKKFIDNYLRYHYWSKCEWEFIALNWPKNDKEIKVDAYSILKPNIPVIAELLWPEVESKIKRNEKNL